MPGANKMTKDQLIDEILQYETPLQGRQLKSYSRQRLEDYLNHLRVMGRKRKPTRPATVES